MSLVKYSETYVPRYTELVEITKEHEKAHWVEDEIPMQEDVEQWKTGELSDNEKNLIKNILRLFTTSDVNVGQGYFDKLIPRIKTTKRGTCSVHLPREKERIREATRFSMTLLGSGRISIINSMNTKR